MLSPPPQPLWVFGYGSLMWAPDFPVAEARLAVAQGWQRSFCMWSIHHRGSVEAPGLVLALEEAPASQVAGLALRVETGAEEATLAMLRARELVSSAYFEQRIDLDLPEGSRISALTYVMDKSHPQYTGAMSLEAQAAIIARACGGRGENCDYLWSTVAHLAQIGIVDADLDWLAARVRALRAEAQ